MGVGIVGVLYGLDITCRYHGNKTRIVEEKEEHESIMVIGGSMSVDLPQGFDPWQAAHGAREKMS